MKLLKPFNLIMFVLIPIFMFLGFSLCSYASGISSKTYQIRHSNTSFNDNIHNCTVNLSGNPSFSINRETNSSSYTGDTIYATLKVTTSDGTFDIKSSSTYISSSTSTSNLGFNDLGTVTLPGYFINLFVDYSSGVYKGGGITGTEYGTITNSSMYTTYSGDITGAIQSTYDMARITGINNSSYGSFTNGTFSNNSEYPITTYTSDSFYAHYSAIDNYYLDSNNSIYRSGGTIAFQNFTLNSNSFDYITIRMHVICENGNDSIIGTYNADYNTFTSLSSSSVIFNFTNTNVTLTSCPVVWYYEYTVYGSDMPIITSFYSPFRNAYFSRVQLNPLNVYDTREAADWQTIEDSDELENFNNTSVSMNEIISDNNDTFNNDYSDYDNYISRVDLSGSKTKFNELVAIPKSYLNAFYTGLPDDIKGFIRIILNIGLAMMVLTVGTRVMRYRGN